MINRLEVKALTLEEARSLLGYDSAVDLRVVLNRKLDRSFRAETRTLNCLRNSNCVYIGDIVGSLLEVSGNLYRYFLESRSDRNPHINRVDGAGKVTIKDLSEALQHLDPKLKIGVIMPHEEWYTGE
ncbi:hypothetical protein HYT24_02800 [Candidatus Pacearchaeota archaeon]|nr:hypothetical protein [Candidatus Pacearchaeota archaeon]